MKFVVTCCIYGELTLKKIKILLLLCLLLDTSKLQVPKDTKYKCEECDDFITNWSSCLSRHKKHKHKGVRYPCDHCTYAATTPCDLRKHKEAIHEGVRYPCDQCNHAATRKATLSMHKLKHVEKLAKKPRNRRDKRKKARYQCGSCDFTASFIGHLQFHTKSKHMEVSYLSDHNYAAMKKK